MRRRIGTLGPTGTDHERAAWYYADMREFTAHVELLDTLDGGIEYLLDDPDALVVANSAHPDVDLLTTRSWRSIGIVDMFGLATMPLALVRRRQSSGVGGIAIMPSTRGYLDLGRFDRVEFVSAKPVALRLLLDDTVEAAIISLNTYASHTDDLELVERIGPVECCWLVYGTRTEVPTGVLAPEAPWQAQSRQRPDRGVLSKESATGSERAEDVVPHRIAALQAAIPDLAPLPPAGLPHRFGLNESPYPPPSQLVASVIDTLTESNRYPDPVSGTLVTALAQRLAVSPEQLTVGPGLVGMCRALVQSTVDIGDEVVFPWPSFDDYLIDSVLYDARAVPVPTRGDQIDLDAVLARINSHTRLIFLATPNNPTGAVLDHDELAMFLDATPPGILVAIDEAYREFATRPGHADAVRLGRKRPHVVALRTFSKAYGLAGLRVAYAVSSANTAKRLRAVLAPFGLSRPAEAAAVAALRLAETFDERTQELIAERHRLSRILRELGWPVGTLRATSYGWRSDPMP
jgi:histidinol-phosphate aminotransferase